jgi:alkanesulfonate monooxygenase SsuD/methylene tetrahydromethanopterin reductase-like flavin-dependent oxidoreductase (luciferase family)
LAKQAVTLSAASEGRFELGLGWGSYPPEFDRFDIPNGDDAPARVDRLERDLALIRQYWGEGDESAVTQQPQPSHRIPLVIGGIGKRTMNLVRQHADWWNIPATELEKLPTLRPKAGSARVSIQQMVGFVGKDADRQAVTEASTRRFSYLGTGLVCGDSAELGDHFANLSEQGVERFYVWFSDFAQPDTLAEFAATVMHA